jgi:hypothetical protein
MYAAIDTLPTSWIVRFCGTRKRPTVNATSPPQQARAEHRAQLEGIAHARTVRRPACVVQDP